MKRGKKQKITNWLVYFGAIIFWSLFWLMFFFVSPINNWRIAGLLGCLLFSLFLTFYLFSRSLFWSGTAAFYLTGLLFLQLIRQLHWLNIILFSAFCLAIFYQRKRLDID